MGTNHKISALSLLLFLAIGLTFSQQTFAQPGVNMSRQDFYDELSPYGDWMDYPSYGQVWRPNVDAGFQPYATDGRWEMTEYGNTWVSDYPWGWAPFHYGRWQFDDYYGWIWIPDYEWGPAWVSWRSGGGYYGWAPLGPGMNIGMNINLPYNYWVFVPDIYIRSPRVFSYCVPRNRIGNIFGSTTYITNYYRYNNRAYVYGPNRYDIERITRSRINVYRADDLHRQYRYGQRNSARNYARNDVRRDDGYARPNYNARDSWNNNPRPNDNNRDRNNDNVRSRNDDNRTPRNDRFDNNGNTSPRGLQPDNTNQPNRGNRGDERTYQAPERGNAQRTWSDNNNNPRNSTDISRNQRERTEQPERTPPQPNRQEQRAYQAPERGGAQRTWSDRGAANPQTRSNQEVRPQRSTSPERGNDTQNGRRRGPNN